MPSLSLSLSLSDLFSSRVALTAFVLAASSGAAQAGGYYHINDTQSLYGTSDAEFRLRLYKPVEGMPPEVLMTLYYGYDGGDPYTQRHDWSCQYQWFPAGGGPIDGVFGIVEYRSPAGTGSWQIFDTYDPPWVE